jgi:hypothetical protein
MMKQRAALRQPLYERMNALPNVRSAAVSAFGLMGSIEHTCFLSTTGRPAQPGDYARRVHISERYFETIGTPILAGRGIMESDRANSPNVVVLSQTAARAVFGGANPVGRLVSTGKTFESKDALKVVGVAQDVRFANPREPFGFVLYVPLTQDPAPVTAVLVRTASDPVRVASAVRGAFREVDPTLLVGAIQPLGASVEAQLSNEKLLALTAVGVYGVIAYSVQRRTQEIGMSGAWRRTRRGVAHDYGMSDCWFSRVLWWAARAFGATRALRSVLFGFDAGDYSLLLAAAGVLFLIAGAAGYLPARRAARLDPMSALRQG